MAGVTSRWESNESGERFLVITDSRTGKRARIPADVVAGRIPFGQYGDQTPTEWAAAKYSNDKSDFEERVKFMSTGPDRRATQALVADLIKKSADQDAEIERLRAELAKHVA